MPKRFYLSTRKNSSARAEALLEALKASGWQRTFDWTDWGNIGSARYAELASAEIAAVKEADVLVVLLPGGFGTHVEIGAALALKKPVIIHAPDHETLETPYACIFHYHPQVKLIVSEVLDVDKMLACMPS